MGLELLQGVRAKLIRAEAHSRSFSEAIRDYEAGNPYSVVRRFEEHIPEKTDRPGLTWRAHVHPAPPIQLSVIAGDCIHNLRSALDHLPWALVLNNGGEPKEIGNPKTQFPILGAPPRNALTIYAASGGPGTAAEPILDMLQPYSEESDPELRAEHPLLVLGRLSNTDKHRILNVVACDFGAMVVDRSDGATVRATRREVASGTMIFWVLSESPDYRADMMATVAFNPSIVFRDTRGLGGEKFVPADKLLATLVQFTLDHVVQRFAIACFGGQLEFPPT